MLGLVAAALALGGPIASSGPAIGEDAPRALPKPPANGVMGFVISEFYQPIVPGKEACPQGPVLKMRDAYLATLAPAERERLTRKENEKELVTLWQRTTFGPNGTNVCSQPDLFDGPLQRTVQSPLAIGLDLDAGNTAEGCAHEEFVTPSGEQGIDNQEYRANGCMLEWRGLDGMPSDNAVGMRQFMASGEWTQVLLLRGVDSLENDASVEVIYANTPDRPLVDSKGGWLPGATFSITTEIPRNRNVLAGRIDNGVLTTGPADIRLTQTWGQGGARDIRGNRSKWHYQKGRLRLAFQADGSLRGVLGGYRPLFDVIVSPALGGAGSALVAGIDCAGALRTLRKHADGMRDPRTGQCTAISSTQRIAAIPAFVNDITAPSRTAAR
jgi:hypothetical protein